MAPGNVYDVMGKFDSTRRHISDIPFVSANWYKHINWPNTYVVIVLSIFGLIAARLRRATAIYCLLFHYWLGYHSGC